MTTRPTDSENAISTSYWWMPFVSIFILLWFMAPDLGAPSNESLFIRAIAFGIGIHLAYLSKDEERNPRWHLLGLLVLAAQSRDNNTKCRSRAVFGSNVKSRHPVAVIRLTPLRLSEMFRLIFVLGFLFVFVGILPAQQLPPPAAKISAGDKIVAAGIALKTGYILRVLTGDSKLKLSDSTNAFSTISKDAESFSDSKAGKRLRKNTEKMRKMLTLLMATDISSGDEALLTVLQANAIDTEHPDPAKIVRLVTSQLNAYILEAQLHDDIFRFPKPFHSLGTKTDD